MRSMILILTLSLTSWSLADKPSKLLKSAVKKTLKADSHSLSISVLGGESTSPQHTLRSREINFSLSSRTYRTLTHHSLPAEAYQWVGADNGAIFQEGRWGALAGWDDGWIILKLHRPLPVILDEVKGLSRRAEWVDAEGEEPTLTGRLCMEGPRDLALAHFDNILNTNERSRQGGDMTIGSDNRWEAIDLVERRSARILYEVQLAADHETITEVEITVLVGMRSSDRSTADDTWGAAPHLAFTTTYTISDLDAVEELEVPAGAQRLLR